MSAAFDVIKGRRKSGVLIGNEDPTFVDPVDQETRRIRLDGIHTIARSRFVEIDPKDIRPYGDGYLAVSGQLYRTHRAIVILDNEIVGTAAAFYRDTDGTLTFLDYVESVATYEQRQQAKSEARLDFEAARTAELRAQPQRAVRLADLEPEHRKVPTLAGAAREILKHGGGFDTVDGRLVVNVPAHLARRLAVAAKVCYLAEPLILSEIANRSKTPLDARLPDAEILPNGALA